MFATVCAPQVTVLYLQEIRDSIREDNEFNTLLFMNYRKKIVCFT
jgi:hypothetical protein